jgi:hypothetical protein
MPLCQKTEECPLFGRYGSEREGWTRQQVVEAMRRIHERDVAADRDVPDVDGRRGKKMEQVRRHRNDVLPEIQGEDGADLQLDLELRREQVDLAKTNRRPIPVLVTPGAGDLAVAIVELVMSLRQVPSLVLVVMVLLLFRAVRFMRVGHGDTYAE